MKKRLSTLFSLFVIAGCQSYYPLPVEPPTKAQYEAYTASASAEIPPPTDLATAKQYAWTFGDVYRQRKNNLHTRIYNHSDASFLGAVVGLIGGIAKAPDWAAGGAAFAAAAELGPSRYQLSVQAANYENAEKAAVCTYEELKKINPTQESELNAFAAADPNNRDKNVGDLTRLTMKQLHAKLEDAQSKVTLLSPDLTKLQKSLEDLVALRAKGAGAPAATAADRGAILYEQLAKNLDKCLALFPSAS